MLISKYKDYDILLEGNMIFSDRFSEILYIMSDNGDNEIVNNIRSLKNSYVDIQNNYIDVIDDKLDMISFLPDDKISKMDPSLITFKIINKNYIIGNDEPILKKLSIPEPYYNVYTSDSIHTSTIEYVNYIDNKELKKLLNEEEYEEATFDSVSKSPSLYHFKKGNEHFLTSDSNVLRNFKDDIPVKKSEVKIGRFIRSLLSKTRNSYSDKDIEEFVNSYKSILTYTKEGLKNFKLVSGEKIKKYYDGQNYMPGGDLANSCMKHKRCQKYFDIYTKNPDVCQLLILKDKDDDSKIQGRALVWKTNKGMYMDRIYSTSQFIDKLFLKYADEKNWITYNEGKNENKSDELKVKIDFVKFKYYPYMDTFDHLYYKKGFLAMNDNSSGKHWELSNTNGGREGDDVKCDMCGDSEKIVCDLCDGSGSSYGGKCHDCDGEGEVDCNDCAY